VDELDKIRQCARPVIFATDVAEYPFSIGGTAFLVGFGGNVFIITAKHVVRSYPPEKLVVYPSDKSNKHIRISNWWNVCEETGNTECSDIIICKADLGLISKKDRKNSYLLALSPPNSIEWFDSRFTATFFLCGYPHDTNEIDNETLQINTGQVLLPARYVGPSEAVGCYKLRAENPLNITNFNGLSGSPVFCIQTKNPFTDDLAQKPKFCGMVLRGSPAEGFIHFIPAENIAEVLHLMNKTPEVQPL
jgi:hypothetical protein